MRIGRSRQSTGHDGIAVHDDRLVAAAGAGAPVVDLRTAATLDLLSRGATADRAAELAAAAFPGSLTRTLSGGDAVTAWMRRLLDEPADAAVVDPERLRLVCPVDPPSYRDFMCFDDHVRNTYAPSGRTPPGVLYELPVYYKGSTATLYGPDEEVPWPHYATELDYELEFALVIGRPGVDLQPEEALSHVFGVTILNDFSDRDMQFREMRGRLGPAKGKDFATAFGPWVVTLDELRPDELAMSSAVNGTQLSSSSADAALWRAEELVAWAAADEPLRPGDVIGSGTAGRGSGLEQGIRLAPGDVVELTIAGIGTLRNRVGAKPAGPGYTPRPRA